MLVASVARSTSCPNWSGSRSGQLNQLRQLASRVDQVLTWSLDKYHAFVVFDAVMLARSTSATYSQDHQGIQWSEHSKLSHLKQVGLGKDVGAACVPHSTSGQGPGLVPGGTIYSGAHLSMFPKIAQARLVLHFH